MTRTLQRGYTDPMEVQQDSLASRVKQLRGDLGITQRELGKRVGVSRVSIFNIEHGSNPRKETLEALARELNTTPEILRGQQ